MTLDRIIRSATADDAERLGLITVSASFATFLGRVPEEHLDFSWSPEASAHGWRKVLEPGGLGADEFFVVAEEAGVVVGYLWGALDTAHPDFDCAVLGLYVAPTRQRTGLGRALIAHAVMRFGENDRTAMLIGCAAVNPSCGFYRRLGGREIYRTPLMVDRHPTEEIFFGWSSLPTLH